MQFDPRGLRYYAFCVLLFVLMTKVVGYVAARLPQSSITKPIVLKHGLGTPAQEVLVTDGLHVVIARKQDWMVPAKEHNYEFTLNGTKARYNRGGNAWFYKRQAYSPEEQRILELEPRTAAEKSRRDTIAWSVRDRVVQPANQVFEAPELLPEVGAFLEGRPIGVRVLGMNESGYLDYVVRGCETRRYDPPPIPLVPNPRSRY